MGSASTSALAFFVAGFSYLAIANGQWPAMMMVWQVVLGVSVVALIAYGAGWLVDASCRIAHFFGISHLVIGLTVVAFGTSAPEIAASLVAGYQGNGDITIANVVGSNVFNICFILGGVAILVKGGLRTEMSLITRDGPVLLIGTLLLFLFVGAVPGSDVVPVRTGNPILPVFLNLRLEPMEGVILLGILIGYLVTLYRTQGRDSVELDEERRLTQDTFGSASWRDVPLFLLGLLMVVGGCHVLVGHAHEVDGVIHGHGALWFARIWDVPDYVVGVTIIAAGTSAPELVVSLVAAMRGAFGLSAGNLIGSDIFNMFGVVGIAGILLQSPFADPVVISRSVVPSLMALSAVVFVTIVFMRTQMRVSRVEGVVLVLIGVARWIADFSGDGTF